MQKTGRSGKADVSVPSSAKIQNMWILSTTRSVRGALAQPYVEQRNKLYLRPSTLPQALNIKLPRIEEQTKYDSAFQVSPLPSHL